MGVTHLGRKLWRMSGCIGMVGFTHPTITAKSIQIKQYDRYKFEERNMWKRLSSVTRSHFREGVLLKFKTIDTAGNHYKYALSVRIDHDEDISFVGLDGRTWGYGRCKLPAEARYFGRKHTVSKAWLLKNFISLAKPEDLNDVWVCDDAMSFLLKVDINA